MGNVLPCLPTAGAPQTSSNLSLAAKRTKGIKYSKVQCVAYEISTRPTGMETETTDDDLYKGIWGEKQGPCWQDCAARVKLFGEALQAARASADVDASPGTLKVFMAPEFLFRGPRGAYKLEALLGSPEKPGLLAELSGLVRGEEWANWMVVFGTIIGYSDEAGKGGNCYNCACVQVGGWRSEEERAEGCLAVLKNYKSKIDFLVDPAQMGAVGLEAIQHMDYEQAAPLTGPATLDADGVFEVGGVTFGLEICLDHLRQRLLLSSPEPGNDLVQVQLIPSCGMSLKFKSIAVQQGGICFGCDGLANGYDGQPETPEAACHSQVYTVPSGPAKRFVQLAAGAPEGTPNFEVNTFFKKQHLREHPKVAKLPAHGADWKRRLDVLFDVSVQVGPQICVYGPLPLPPRVRVVQE